MRASVLALGLAAAFLVAGCESDPEKPEPTVEAPPPPPPAPKAEAPSSGSGMLGFLSSSDEKKDERKGVPVNAYLWRASLDTLRFAPLEVTDSFGGIIKTGWYTPPNAPNERLKITVLILDSRLRAEALRLSVFKELKKPTGDWIEASVDPNTVTELENIILTKARELKIQSE